MSSLSNLLKANWVVVEDDKRIIDNNERADAVALEFQESRTRQGAELLPEGAADPAEFEEGLNAEQLEQLTGEAHDVSGGADTSGAGSEMSAQLQAEAEARAGEIVAQAQAQADELLSQARQDAEQIRSQAAEEGRSQGYGQGFAQGRNEAEAAAADELAQEKQRLELEYRKLLEAAEPEMVDVLTRIYERVFSVNLSDDKNIILHLLRTALSRVDASGDLIVHVSPADYDLVTDEKERLAEAVASPNAMLQIVEDSLLKENECMIETNGGVFDCSLGVELSELARRLKLLSMEQR